MISFLEAKSKTVFLINYNGSKIAKKVKNREWEILSKVSPHEEKLMQLEIESYYLRTLQLTKELNKKN